MGDVTGKIGDLADRLKEGDTQALASSFSHHRDRLWRLVCFRIDRRLLGRVDPDDVLQEAYLAAAKRIKHFEGSTDLSLFIWLRLIVLQTLTDVHRQHLGAKMRDVGREVAMRGVAAGQSTSTSLAAQIAASITSPSQAAMRGETNHRLEESLEKMDAIDREVLALRHYEELSNSEVAQVLGIQQKAASIRYIRALKRFKAIVSQFPEFLD